MRRIAIIGGGPGGLITAYRLAHQAPDSLVTVYEAGDRPGGKLATRRFERGAAQYESGAAECYGYRHLGPDPLRDLVDELGLDTLPMEAGTFVLDGVALEGPPAIAAHLGRRAAAAVADFREASARAVPLARWHPEDATFDAAHPWSDRSGGDLLEQVGDATARRFLQVAAHTDLATEPHRTSALNGLKNVLLDVPGYVECYGIAGGMSRLAEALVARCRGVRFRCRERVTAVDVHPTHGSTVESLAGGRRQREPFDFVVAALPPLYLNAIEWRTESLAVAMHRHLRRFDHPGHYLRASLLFDRPFWSGHLAGSWFMLDAFGGTCVYHESDRYRSGGAGVLGFLLAGHEALRMGNLPDERIVAEVIDSLPDPLPAAARRALLEARIHRWAAGVSALPGGRPAARPDRAHQPDPRSLPGLYVVGDYLYDSTLNGVCQSAQLVADRIARTPANEAGRPHDKGALRPAPATTIRSRLPSPVA